MEEAQPKIKRGWKPLAGQVSNLWGGIRCPAQIEPAERGLSNTFAARGARGVETAISLGEVAPLDSGGRIPRMDGPNLDQSSPWRRLALISFFIGLGIAVAVFGLLASLYWYSNRPKPWNTQAIRPRFNRSDSFVTLEEWYQNALKGDAVHPVLPSKPLGYHLDLGKMTVLVSYDLENATQSDYTLEPAGTTGLIAMQRLRSSRALIDAKDLKWSVAEPENHLWVSDPKEILIPAGQTVRVSFGMEYDLTDENSDAVKVKNWDADGVQKKIVQDLLSDVDAFVLMDNAHRYQIDLSLQGAGQ